MSKFVVNEDMFGKYCTIPTGCSRLEHIYKIVTRIESNTYCDIPLYSGQTEETTHKDVVPVLLVIHCGIDESEVIRVPLAKCKICDDPNGWISVKDRLPDSGRDVIACSDLGAIFKCRYCRYHTVGKYWVKDGILAAENITHWRELPDPPRMEGKNED